MLNILDIAQGHVNELFNINDEISKNRMKICYRCPLFSKKLGGVCNSNLWLNPETDEISTNTKPGYIRGCNCRLLAKTRLPNSRCIAGKW